MSVALIKLKDRAANTRIEAELHDNLVFSDVIDSERRWRSVRLAMASALEALKTAPAEWPQHLHWDWEAKLASGEELDIGNALSPYRLMGIRLRGGEVWQGLVLATCVGHIERADGRGRDILYVKYLETAPWNLVVNELGQQGRYGGVGSQLLRSCVALSRALELRGRLGLHALPQAERFYHEDCGMTDFGIDDGVEGLRYFEMTEEQADTFIKTGKGDRR